jgi:hypothetical protein
MSDNIASLTKLHAMKILIVILFLLLSGCSYMMCAAGFCDAYDSERLNAMESKWNQWLGKTKDERIKDMGPPDKCAVLDSGEEVCEWRRGGVSGGGSYNPYTGVGDSSVSSWEHRIIFTYDKDRIARAWSYRGSLGQRSSKGTNVNPQSGSSTESRN